MDRITEAIDGIRDIKSTSEENLRAVPIVMRSARPAREPV